MSKKSKHKPVTQAFLDLSEAQTELEIFARNGRAIDVDRAEKLGAQIGLAIRLLQQTINAAARVLEDGPEELV